MTKKIEYAFIPVDSLEIDYQSADIYRLFYNLKLEKQVPYNLLKIKNIAVKITSDEVPYVEEVLTKKRIGLNKKSTYKIYMPGNVIYQKCSEEDAYSFAKEENYIADVRSLFGV